MRRANGTPHLQSSCRKCEAKGARSRTLQLPHRAEYKAWLSMHDRCNNPKSNGYHNYGGRGITVDPIWESFDQFLADMGPRPSSLYSLDRIDVNGNYAPGNCRWATAKEQANNRQHHNVVTAFGKTQTIQAWADEYGMTRGCLFGRITTLGWPPEKALTEPVRVRKLNKNQDKS